MFHYKECGLGLWGWLKNIFLNVKVFVFKFEICFYFVKFKFIKFIYLYIKHFGLYDIKSAFMNKVWFDFILFDNHISIVNL